MSYRCKKSLLYSPYHNDRIDFAIIHAKLKSKSNTKPFKNAIHRLSCKIQKLEKKKKHSLIKTVLQTGYPIYTYIAILSYISSFASLTLSSITCYKMKLIIRKFSLKYTTKNYNTLVFLLLQTFTCYIERLLQTNENQLFFKLKTVKKFNFI